MSISPKKQLAYFQQAIYNNKGYFIGQKEAVPIDGTGIKIMRSGTEKQWVLPALIVIGVLFRPTAENAEERKATGLKYRHSGNG
jgi:murein endopeptidase